MTAAQENLASDIDQRVWACRSPRALTAAKPFLAALAAAFWIVPAATASAQVFEVIHPDVDKGGFEFESLNGVSFGDVDTGDERSAHEIALGFAPTSWWKTTGAVELANPDSEPAEFEAYEWENVFLAPLGDGHAHGHGHDHGHGHGEASVRLTALGLYAALEVPNEDGISKGAVALGPLVELGLGPVNTISNLFVEVPFEDGEDPGLAYAMSATVPAGRIGDAEVAAGLEAHGTAEGAFGDALPLGENSHVLGPAVYGDIDIGRERVLEPRLALLFGLTDGSPDVVPSLNFELKF